MQTPAPPQLLPTESKGWRTSLQALSLPELAGVLEDRVREMGEVPGPSLSPCLPGGRPCPLRPRVIKLKLSPSTCCCPGWARTAERHPLHRARAVFCDPESGEAAGA